MVEAMTLTLSRLLVRVNDAARQPDERLAQAFPGLVAAVESAFRQEEDLMEATAYPGLRAHRRDNALFLCALHHAAAQVECGDTEVARQVIAALPGLLSLHRFTVLGMLHHGVPGERVGVVVRNGRACVYTEPRHRAR